MIVVDPVVELVVRLVLELKPEGVVDNSEVGDKIELVAMTVADPIVKLVVEPVLELLPGGEVGNSEVDTCVVV